MGKKEREGRLLAQAQSHVKGDHVKEEHFKLDIFP